MSREVSLLVPEFRSKLEQLLENCLQRGITMNPYFTLRTPQEQGSVWRQGRTQTDAELKAMALDHAGAPFLAQCIRENQPKETNLITNALPGFSWYQWGEACDCVWVDNNKKLNWNPIQKINGVNGYQLFAEEAVKLGLSPGGYWEKKPEWPHVELRPRPNPVSYYTTQEINAEMEKRFVK